MMNFISINNKLLQGIKEIPYATPHELFLKINSNYEYKFLLESKDISHIYGRLSLIGIDPALKISGKGDNFEIVSLNPRGDEFLKRISDDDLQICDFFKRTKKIIKGIIKKEKNEFDEKDRPKRKNIAQILRFLLEKFKIDKKCFLGLYGAFSYDFVRLFEDIGDNLNDNKVNDFTLFLYDSFIFIDHLKEKVSINVFRDTRENARKDVFAILNQLKAKPVKKEYSISNAKFSLSKSKYQELVELAKKYALKGEIFEVVFSNILKTDFKGDPFALYLKYREINPSPYLFYYDFKDEQLVGASPEMMVRVEDRKVHLRPISGTIRRGKDPIEDYENMLALLNDAKEKSELDMLVDLGRNDLSRICKPGLEIKDYRFVEKYSRVMHTVAHITGELKDDYICLDALVSCINAGTLTGAPKVSAMNLIEKHEKERRGYYGGTVGYMTFAGDMDTGIIIRTAHIRDGHLRFQVGATLLHNSVPKNEYAETISKAQAFLDTINL